MGKNVEVSWIDHKGVEKKLNYEVPNLNQCKNCHSTDNKISPIGITAAQLNQRYHALQSEINQLDYFKQEGLLNNFTTAESMIPCLFGMMRIKQV